MSSMQITCDTKMSQSRCELEYAYVIRNQKIHDQQQR